MITQVATYRPAGTLECGIRYFYTLGAPLGLLLVHQFRGSLVGWTDEPYTLRSSGARGLDVSPFYRHIAPLERKVEYAALTENRWIFNT